MFLKEIVELICRNLRKIIQQPGSSSEKYLLIPPWLLSWVKIFMNNDDINQLYSGNHFLLLFCIIFTKLS